MKNRSKIDRRKLNLFQNTLVAGCCVDKRQGERRNNLKYTFTFRELLSGCKREGYVDREDFELIVKMMPSLITQVSHVRAMIFVSKIPWNEFMKFTFIETVPNNRRG